MRRLFPVLVLALFTGCASQVPDPERQTQLGIERATHDYQEARLRDIYGKGFTLAFLDIWEGSNHSPGDRFGPSTDPDGDAAYLSGYYDGLRAGSKAKIQYEEAKIEYEEKRAKEKH